MNWEILKSDFSNKYNYILSLEATNLNLKESCKSLFDDLVYLKSHKSEVEKLISFTVENFRQSSTDISDNNDESLISKILITQTAFFLSFYSFLVVNFSYEMSEASKDEFVSWIVCMGGKPSRMLELAKEWRNFRKENINTDEFHDYSSAGDRFSMFKENQVLFLSHGMGGPSISIALNEVTKLLHFAGVTDAFFVRIGTCGGLGLEPGTIVVSERCYDANLNDFLELFICGKSYKRKAILDKSICDEFIESTKDLFGTIDHVKVVKANTMCANDFYEEQARMDGANNMIETTEKQIFFQKLVNQYGIRNIEMESLGFAAFCHNLNIKGMVVAIILVDRLISDFVTLSGEEIKHFQRIVNQVLMNFFARKLKLN